MKKFTPFFTMGMLAASAAFSANAQATFVKADQLFHATHRTRPAIADLNNSGKLDIIWGGQGTDLFNFEDGDNWYWQTTTCISFNQGDATFVNDVEGVNLHWENVYDEDGNQVFNEDGTPQQTLYKDRVWPEHGVVGTSGATYGLIDYNNDGLIDLLVFAKAEWDVFDYKDDNFLYLYKNLGNGKFELVTEAAFPHMRNDGGGDGKQVYQYALAIGDYDQDGYVDFAVSATGVDKEEDTYPGRCCNLYRNINGTGAFQDMKIAETKGGVWTNEVKDDDGNVMVEKKELEGWFLPVSGNVHMVDVNNDGWLDIVCDGWCDNNWDGIHSNGTTAKIYLNQKGEKFVDATPDVPTFEALRSSASSFADFDGDGYLDYFFTGWGDNGYGWAALLYYNTVDENAIYETNVANAELGVDGTENCRQIIRDFDGDGLLDIYYAGAAGCKIYYGNYNGSFTKDEDTTTFPLPGYGSDGGGAVGDFNGNGLADIFVCGYGIDTNLFLNQETAVEAPAAPENVTVERVDGKLVITWEYDEATAQYDNLAYNVFVKKANGEVYSLIPADTETGMIKVGEGREVLLRPNVMEYTLNYDGEAEVGVQAVSLANETASEFATAATAGIEAVKVAESAQKVTVAGDAVTVAGNGEAVNIYSVTGQKVATGVAGQAIRVEGHGVFVVSTAAATTKIVK